MQFGASDTKDILDVKDHLVQLERTVSHFLVLSSSDTGPLVLAYFRVLLVQVLVAGNVTSHEHLFLSLLLSIMVALCNTKDLYLVTQMTFLVLLVTCSSFT